MPFPSDLPFLRLERRWGSGTLVYQEKVLVRTCACGSATCAKLVYAHAAFPWSSPFGDVHLFRRPWHRRTRPSHGVVEDARRSVVRPGRWRISGVIGLPLDRGAPVAAAGMAWFPLRPLRPRMTVSACNSIVAVSALTVCCRLYVGTAPPMLPHRPMGGPLGSCTPPPDSRALSLDRSVNGKQPWVELVVSRASAMRRSCVETRRASPGSSEDVSLPCYGLIPRDCRWCLTGLTCG